MAACDLGFVVEEDGIKFSNGMGYSEQRGFRSECDLSVCEKTEDFRRLGLFSDVGSEGWETRCSGFK